MLKRILRRIKQRFIQPCRWPHSFSQEGEDGVLSRIFDWRDTPGFYVDVGAHHPTRFSNTYRFYLDGWKGINIDPLPDIMACFDRLRPRDINLNAAIASESKILVYHMFNEPALNTFDQVLAKQRDGQKHYRLVEIKQIQTQPLSTILAEHLPPGQEIDFLSVDVEGTDLDVLQSNDWSRFRPDLVLAEDFNATTVEQALACPVTTYMNEVGYDLLAKTVHTLFFRRRSPRT